MAANVGEEERDQRSPLKTLVCHTRRFFLVGSEKSLKAFKLGELQWADLGLYLEGKAERDLVTQLITETLVKEDMCFGGCFYLLQSYACQD